MNRSWGLVLGGCLLVAGCESGVEGRLVVAPLGAQEGGAAPAALRSSAATLEPSSGPYAYAQVEGVRLFGGKIRMDNTTGDNSEFDVGDLTLVSGAQGFSLDETVEIFPGDYRSATLRFQNAYAVKAMCRTATKLMYTRADGIGVLDCASEDCDNASPSDYDYYRYEFIYTTTAEGPDATGDTAQEETVEPFTIDAEAAGDIRVAMLVDTSYLVGCYDGTESIGDGYGMTPFNQFPRRGSARAYFPDREPAFGIGYIPLFIWVSTDAEEPLPRGETYAAGGYDFSTELDLGDKLVSTFAFREDGTVLAARGRNFDLASVDLNQYFSGYADNGDGSLSFYNGEWYWDDNEPGRAVQDRMIAGFTRTALGAPVFETSLEDGPECGQSLVTEHGNQSRACMDRTQPLFWQRIRRDDE